MKKILLILISTIIPSLNALNFQILAIQDLENNNNQDLVESKNTSDNKHESIKDNIYLLENNWGLDYLDEYVNVFNFSVETTQSVLEDNSFKVDNNVNVSGLVKGNINLFRHILPEDKTLEINNLNSLNFLIKNNEDVEIVLMQDDDREWENRIRYTVPANKKEKEYTISINEFLDDEGNSIEITNIKTIVFSVINDYENYIPFNFIIKNLSFKANNVLEINDFTKVKKLKLINYPNPFTNTTTVRLPNSSEFVYIRVFDLLGRTVDFKKIATDNSKTKLQYNTPQLKSGMYKYKLIDDKNETHSGTFIVK